MTTALLMQLITVSALLEGMSPETALTIAKIESNYSMKATGPVGEIGAFQILPKYSKYSKEELRNPLINVKEGLRILKEAKAKCIHQDDKTYVICYNVGIAGSKKIKHPKKFEYYKRFVQTREEMRRKINNISLKHRTMVAKK